jgi:hypothetical protein
VLNMSCFDQSPSITGDAYAVPVARIAAGTGAFAETYKVNGVTFTVFCGPSPFDPRTGAIADGHDVFDADGNWVGADSFLAYRRITSSAAVSLTARCKTLFDRYAAGDYGAGEAGFAEYTVDGDTFWIIDDAVRTPQGMPPRRDPNTSPGPQTLLTPRDY